MDADTAHVAALVGALGAALVLLARGRAVLVAGFGLLAGAEGGLGLAIVGTANAELLVSPATAGLALVGAALLAAGAAVLVRWPAAVTPLVLLSAPFRLPLDFTADNRFFVAIAEPGELGRLLLLYVVLAVGALALLFRCARGHGVERLPLVISVPAAAFVAFAALSLLWSRDLEAGASVLAFFLLPFAALVAVVGRAPFAPWVPRALAAVAVTLATLFATIGLWQAATKELLFFAPNLEVSNTYAPIFRVTSLFRDPSLYGRHVVLGIAVLVVVLALRRVPLLVGAALVALLGAGLYVSYSQSSLAALFVVVLGIGAVTGARRARRVVAGTAAAVLLAGAVLVARETADTSVRRATSDRSRRVELTARVLAEHPVGGVGLGGQPVASQELSKRYGPTPRFVSHSTPLTVGAELGVIGLVAYLALLAGAAVLVEIVRRRDAALGLALGAALLALFVHALFYSGFFEDPITWFVLGVAASFVAAREPVAEGAARIAARRAPATT